MVFDARLGYDPDEWEECAESEHFMVFSPFMRYFLTAAAIAFIYYFFKVLDEHKNGGSAAAAKAEEDEQQKKTQTTVQQVLEGVSHRLQHENQTIPKNADDLIREADDYLRNVDVVQPVFPNGTSTQQEKAFNKFPSLELDLNISKPSFATREKFDNTLYAVNNHLQETANMDVSPKSQTSFTQFDQVPSEASVPPVPQHQHPITVPTAADRQLLQEFDVYEQIGQPIQRGPLGQAPGPHQIQHPIAIHGQQHQPPFSQQQHPEFHELSPGRDTAFAPVVDRKQQQQKAGREKRLSEQDERALQDWEKEKALLEAERIKKLLDHEVGGDSNTDLSTSQKAFEHFAPASHISYESHSHSHDAALIQQPLTPLAPKRNDQQLGGATTTNIRDSQLTDYDISDFNVHEVIAPIQEKRRTTGDSDDYVKVSDEPIYDFPPPVHQQQPEQKKRISPTEAAQLQELYQEYDLGLDIPGIVKVPDSPKTVVNVPISRRTDVPIRHEATNFVMEEEMLSGGDNEPWKRPTQKQQSAAGDPTSRQVRTNDVFERLETDEHDDMTYAPEIQSVEIPPDQLSETSENIIDYFDKVAAESEAQIKYLQQQESTLKRNQQKPVQVSSTNRKPVGRAPQILPAFGNRAQSNSSIGSARSGSGVSSSDVYPYRHLRKQSSLLSVLGVTSMQEMLLTINSLDSLSEAMRRAGLETTNLIFGIDYTASNKYQGEESFGGRSLHTIHPHVKNPYQQVITILGRTLAPFAGHGNIGVYGFGDAKTGDWSVFNLNQNRDCRTLDEVLSVYNTVTPTVALSGPTNFAPLIYQAMETCQKSRDYHILVIIADGQVTNERATRRAIVQACQHPLSIIVVGVGDGPWDMMRVFDESLPKRPWDNFHFVEFHEIMKKSSNIEDGDVKVAVQSLLEIPDQYRCICELGLLDRSIPPRGSEIRRELMHNPL